MSTLRIMHVRQFQRKAQPSFRAASTRSPFLIGPASADAAPLLSRTFPLFDQKSDLEPRWLDNDFHPRWLASDLLMSWGGSHRELLLKHLPAKTNSLIQRVSSLWSLRKDLRYARQFVPAIVSIIADPAEPPLLKIACLHTLGRIPDIDPNLLTRAIEQYEFQFHPLPVAAIANGDFTQSHWSGTNQIPADAKPPHVLYTNWFTWNGVIGRNLSNGWIGPKIELGPRSPPGSISQAFRTTPGATYQIQFEAANGRNIGLQLSVGDMDKTCVPSSSDPTKPSKFTYQFRALSPLTTLTFSGLEYDGYGPFIDNVVVGPGDRKSD